jgi:UDP-4-amino-4,6-dideoxy-N-acetyl-beta-L-altrosamine transaminase
MALTKMIPYGKQEITEDDIAAVVATLKSDFLTQGPKIKEFEDAFASYIGCKYAVAVANGTAALHLCALALDVQQGDKIITSPITFAASANCVRYCGGDVVFADIDPNTFLLNIKAVEQLLVAAPKGTYKGIIPVDFGGRAVDLEVFRKLADQHGVWIIEDACHAPGGFFIDSKGSKQQCGNGNFADLAIFSFHPVKHIAAGEGGMITTNDKVLYEKLLMLRTHGITRSPEQFKNSIAFAAGEPSATSYPRWYMEMQELGFNYRLTDFQAALGASQLQRAHAMLEKRLQIAKRYDEAFSNERNIKCQLLELGRNPSGHAYHLYVIHVQDRLGLYEHLTTKGIIPQIHYIPCHLMPYYRQLGWKEGDLPKAEAYYKTCLSLPMYPALADNEQQLVIDTIVEYVGK